MKQALVIAGGLGTRMGEATRQKPKCLVEIRGLPILAYILDGLIQSGVQHVVITVGKEWGTMIEEYVRTVYSKLQADFPCCAHHGVSKAIYDCRPLLNPEGPLLITVGDLICFNGYASLWKELESVDFTFGTFVSPLDSEKEWTWALFEKNGQLRLSKHAGYRIGQEHAMAGVYALRPVSRFLDYLSAAIDAVHTNIISTDAAQRLGILGPTGEYRLSFVFETLSQNHCTISHVDMSPCWEINTVPHLIKVEREINLLVDGGNTARSGGDAIMT